jgi:exodeoxyribonuclease III
MKIATWNVNSIRVRLPRLIPWLRRVEPDVVCLQETKVVDEDFPAAEFQELGYRCLTHGQRTYNGVAILSRLETSDVMRNLPDDGPGAERRLLAATIGGIRIIDVYAPNGRFVGSDSYTYKLEWFRRLRAHLDSSFNPDLPVLVCGDFNVAPEDRDVWDPEKWRGQILFSEPEKEALQYVRAWGLEDALRLRHPEAGLFTWWDYRAGAFHRGWGLRIDHILISKPLIDRCGAVEIHRDERKGMKPSDHAPVIISLES